MERNVRKSHGLRSVPAGPLLDVPALAELCGVPVATVYQWNYLGTGPRRTKLGRHVRYHPEAVAEWLAEHEGGDAA